MLAAGYATGHFGKWHRGGGRDVNDTQKISAHGCDATFKYPTGRDRCPNLAVRQGPWNLQLNADGSGLELCYVVTASS